MKEGSSLNRMSVVKEIDELVDQYCEGCLVRTQLSKERGKTGAHRFCINGCSIGEQLQFLGNELLKWHDSSVGKRE